MTSKLLIRKPLHDCEVRGNVHFLTLLDTRPIDIWSQIVRAYGRSAPTYQTICNWVKAFNKGRSSLLDQPRTGRPKDKSIRAEIEDSVRGDDTLSSREIALMTGHSHTTVSTVLKLELHLVQSSLKYVAHELTQDQKDVRVRFSMMMLTYLNLCNHRNITDLWTQDETWVMYDNPFQYRWIDENEERIEAERKTVASKKVMISVMFNFGHFHSVTMLPKGSSFTKAFFSDIVLPAWQRDYESIRPAMKVNGLTLHMDNARVHNVDELLGVGRKPVTLTPHQPSTPEGCKLSQR